MKFLKKLALFTALSFSCQAPANLQTAIDNMINPYGSSSHIGMVIRQANSGQIVYSRLPNFLFPPASIQKVLTATAALAFLGPNFTYKTKLWIDGPIIGNILHGDVTIQFSGDPELTAADLQQLIFELKARGVQQILGNIRLDTSIYDNVPYPPGWLWDDLSYSYAAPLYSIIINKNKFGIRLTPQAIGQRPLISTSVPSSIFHFSNMVTTTDKYNPFCPLTIYSDVGNHYILSGCMYKGAGAQSRTLALRDPLPYAKALIRSALTRANIYFNGRVDVEKVGPHDTFVTEHTSVPLNLMLRTMLKRSDNLITNSLLKQIGYQYFHQQGSWTEGLLALQNILAKPTGLNFKYNLINDGAGLSRYNLITPYQMSAVLEYIFKTPNLRDVIIPALPIAGNDGTLARRMSSEAKEKRIRAKTGSITGVSTLAGYVYTRHMGVLTFVIMVNGFVGKRSPYIILEDRICEFLARYQGDPHG